MNIEEKEKEISTNTNCIILFNDNIFITKNSNHNNIYFYDYFNILVNKRLEDNNEEIKVEGLFNFSINITKRIYQDYKDSIIMNNEDIQKQIYNDLIERLQIINDEEVNIIYKDILEKRIIKKLTETVNPEQIIEREQFHFQLINEYIIQLIKVSTRRLYEISAEGMTKLDIRFDKLNEQYLTDNNAKIYYHLPNADGKMRITFDEYFYYLLEKKYKKEGDELSDYEWASNIILGLCKKICQLFYISLKSTEIQSVLPIVTIEIKVNMDMLLI